MTESELNEILKNQENASVEYKSGEAFKNIFRVKIAAEIAALANNRGGGKLIIGIDDESRAIVGIEPSNLATYKSEDIRNYLKSRVSPEPKIQLENIVTDNGKNVVIIHVAEFNDVPHIISRHLDLDGNKRITEGTILIRTVGGESRAIETADQMRELLSRAMTKRSEELLSQIRTVVKGEVPSTAAAFTPSLKFELLDQNREKLIDASINMARWEFFFSFSPETVQKFPAKESLAAFEAESIKWSDQAFPQYSHGHITHYADSFGLQAIDLRLYELWEFNRFGMFQAIRVPWYEVVPQDKSFPYEPPPKRPLQFEDMFITPTAYLAFTAAIARRLHAESISISLSLKNTLNRRLDSFDPHRHLWPDKISKSPELNLNYHLFTADLASAWRIYAARLTLELLNLFQLNDATEERILELQEEYIPRMPNR